MGLSGFIQRSLLASLTLVFLSYLFPVNGQDLEPRAYTNIPVGLSFAVAGYGYSAGGVVFDPTIPLENANIRIHGSVAGYARSIKVGGMSGKVDIIIPFVWLTGSADFQGQPVTRDVAGMGDPRVRMTLNFIGSPALPLSGFKDFKQNLIIGASLQVFMPLGQYDFDRLVNIGTHRFTFKPELGISKTFGHLFLELAGGASFYTVNNDFFNGKTRSQAPIGSIQGHVNYSIKNGVWVALDGTYYWGGRTTVDGVVGDDLQKNTRLGLTLSFPVNIRHSLKIYASTGVSTRTGSDYDAIGLVWQYRWGKGLGRIIKT